MEERVVLHVDMDAFYAAVEARDDPKLRGIPLVVGADPRGGRGRGVVCTASYEARRYGIRSAMPISQAYRAAPHAAFVRPDFRKYAEESRRVMGILARYADVLEVVGMDEAYLDVTAKVRSPGGTAHGTPDGTSHGTSHGTSDGTSDGTARGIPDGTPDWGLASSLARSLQAAVKRELGLSCSVGVAPCKAVAKVASDARKPHGVFVLPPDQVRAYLDPLPAGKLHGCGPKTAAALREAGIHTVGDLARAPLRDLETRFGAHGAWLHRVAQGDDPRPVDGARSERKSRGNETTFPRDQADASTVRRVAAGLLDELLDDQVRRDGRTFTTVTVKLRYGDFTTLTRARTAPRPLAAADPAARHAASAAVAGLLAPLLDGRPVRLVGVRLSNFGDPAGQQGLSAYGIAWAGIADPGLHGASLHGAGLQDARLQARAERPAGAFDPGGLRWSRLADYA